MLNLRNIYIYFFFFELEKYVLHIYDCSRCMFILRLSARLFILLGLIGGVMSHLDFQYISIVAWSYICVYRPVFPVWRCKTLKSAW